MIKIGHSCALIGAALTLANAPALGFGALAVGSTSNVSKDGIAMGASYGHDSAAEASEAALSKCRGYKPAPKAAAQCRLIGTFQSECYAISLDPKAGTPGAGWAIAATKAQAEERALENCKATAGARRRAYCRVELSRCDGTE